MIRPSKLVCTILFVGTAFVNVAMGDTVTLTNGNRLEGKILREDATHVFIAVGGAEMRLARSQVREIERGISRGYFEDQVSKAQAASANALKRDDYAGASRALQEISLEIQEARKGLDPADEDLAFLDALMIRIDTARQKTVPPDPENIEAERLYQEAMDDIDFVKYGDAFEKLRKAGALAPQRGDIQARLANMAGRTGRPMEAVRAYRQLLQIDPDTYYARVGEEYLTLLRSEGTRLINLRQADQAVVLFEDVLLLEDASGGKPVSVADFLARRAARETQSEEEVLMEVYRYADGNDLVDLAFAAVTKIDALGGDNPEIKALVAETRFLSRLKAAIDQGDSARAASVLAENPELAGSEKLTDKVKRLSGAEARAIEAQRILGLAKKAFADRDYETAAENARRVVAEYSEEEAASEAASILVQAEKEGEIKGRIDEAIALVDDGHDDEAETIVSAMIVDPIFMESTQFPLVQQLQLRIPRERRADELWLLASADLDAEKYAEALVRLDELAGSFGETRSGRKAAEWLKKQRARLFRESTLYRPKEADYIAAWTDLNFWRAAADPAIPRKTMEAPPIQDERKKSALEAFEAVMTRDEANRPAGRSFAHWFLAPLSVCLLLLAVLVLKFASWGRGRFRTARAEGEAPLPDDTHCRSCGLPLPEDQLSCDVCGGSRALTDDEAIREADEKRRSDFDPWNQRVKGDSLNQFDEYFQRAKELAETSDAQAAIDACREALREDPKRVEGYALLGELYERTGQKDEAAICYREILLIDPGDAMVRQKLDASTPRIGLDPGPLPAFLAGCCWWLIAFVAIGIDGEAIALRLTLSLFGGLLTYYYFRIRRRFISVAAKQKSDIDVHRPLSGQKLSWHDQNKEAKLLAQVIEEHTGITVPVLSTWRVLWAIVLSLMLLAAMALYVWQGGLWYLLLGWPAGAALIIYLVEIHPRVYTANVLLRHFMEELLDPWADPHKPFHPRGIEAPIGEFLLRKRSELPLRWAIRPLPYSSDRMGVLNSLLQVMNRHWSFHRYYERAQVKRDVRIPVPQGIRFSWMLLIVAMLAITGAAWHRWYDRSETLRGYDENMKIGHQLLLDGDIGSAVDYFSRAARQDPDRAAPYLYSGHAYAAVGMERGARRSFAGAATRARNVPQVYNDYANYLQRQGEMRQAIEQYRAALEYDPANADVLSNCGSALYKLQVHEQAAHYLKKAIAADPHHSRANTTLGLVLEEMGDREGARVAYETAVEVAPDMPYTNVARQRLADELAPKDESGFALPDTQASGGGGQ